MSKQTDPDDRWSATTHSLAKDADFLDELQRHYPALGRFEILGAYSSVHDVVQLVASGSSYALKLYRPGTRSPEDIRWETALVAHLVAAGAPVAEIVSGEAGPIEILRLDGIERMAVLSKWVPGEKPSPSEPTYRLLGRAAAQIHLAAESFETQWPRLTYDVDTEIYRQLALLRPLLEEIDRWEDAAALGEKVARFVRSADLERGVSHRDLTLDNVHTTDSEIHVFDFDSAGETWRAWEPYGVYEAGVLFNDARWDWYRAGYSEVRTMRLDDQRAVPVFTLMAQFENVAWKLGLTPTSAGRQLDPGSLGERVDSWQAWADTQCRGLL